MLPDVPTTAGSRHAAIQSDSLVRPLGAQGTPSAIIEKLNKALGAALDDPAVVERFAELGYDVVPPEKRSSAYFDKFYKDEVALWAKVLGGLVHERSQS